MTAYETDKMDEMDKIYEIIHEQRDNGFKPAMYEKVWTTFLKARLNCSIPGEFPFYFDEIRKFPSKCPVRGQARVRAGEIWGEFELNGRKLGKFAKIPKF